MGDAELGCDVLLGKPLTVLRGLSGKPDHLTGPRRPIGDNGVMELGGRLGEMHDALVTAANVDGERLPLRACAIQAVGCSMESGTVEVAGRISPAANIHGAAGKREAEPSGPYMQVDSHHHVERMGWGSQHGGVFIESPRSFQRSDPVGSESFVGGSEGVFDLLSKRRALVIPARFHQVADQGLAGLDHAATSVTIPSSGSGLQHSVIRVRG